MFIIKTCLKFYTINNMIDKNYRKTLLLILVIFTLLATAMSYVLALFDKSANETVTVTLITTVLGAVVTYLICRLKSENGNGHKNT